MQIQIHQQDLHIFAPTIFDIVKKTFVRNFDPPTDSIEDVLNYLADCKVFGVFDSDVPVGYFAFCNHASSEVELKSIALLPSYQGKGIGKQMLNVVFEESIGKAIWLVVHPKNVDALIRYIKSGFIMCGWKDDFFGDGQPRIVMERANSR